VGKAGKKSTLEWSTWKVLHSGRVLPYLQTLQRTVVDKHSSLLHTIVNYGCKLFYNVVPCGMYYKCVTIVIYDHNDSGLYYKTS
jgi:hypothetical protein